MLKKTFLFISLIFLFIIEIVGARTASSLKANISYTLNPEIPAPGEYVILNVNSPSLRLDSSNISYYINEEKKESGLGKKEFIF
jgi:hypothetical protein